MYAVSDFLQYSLYPARLTIDKDFVASTSPGTERDFEEMQLDYGKVQAEIRLGLLGKQDDVPDTPMPAAHNIGRLDEAWTQDFGFAFTSMVTMLRVMALWASYTGSPEKASYSASADEIASACMASIDDFESSSTPRILDFLTLKAEDILKIATKNGDEVATTLPVWEHSKRLSRYAIKPLVRIRDTYYWGPHSADRSCRVWAGVPTAFRLPADFPAANVKTILERGHDDSARCLQDKIAQIARRHTSAVRTEVFPHKFDGSVGDIGDCDVLAFLQSANILLNIESKVIDPAYCVKDAGRIQRKIFGRITSSGQPEVGYLQRVEARHAYLQANALELIAGLGWQFPSESPRVVSVFVTPTSYWWTMFPPIASDVTFLEIRLLDDFIRTLSS